MIIKNTLTTAEDTIWANFLYESSWERAAARPSSFER